MVIIVKWFLKWSCSHHKVVLIMKLFEYYIEVVLIFKWSVVVMLLMMVGGDSAGDGGCAGGAGVTGAGVAGYPGCPCCAGCAALIDNPCPPWW